MEYDNISGYGPQAGGFYATEGERRHQENLRRGAMDVMEFAAIHNEQYDRIRKSIVQPMAGGAAAADDWLYNTKAGFAARAAIAGIQNRDPLGYGSPQAFALGLTQATGTGGMSIRDNVSPGGVDRSFGGGGAITNQITKQLYGQLQKDFFGGGRNNVGGLNQTDTGVLLGALGERGAFKGNIATMREASVEERVNQMRELSDTRIGRLTKGIKSQNDLDNAIKGAKDSGDTVLLDSLNRVNSSTQIFEIDQGAKDKMKRTTQAAAGMLTALSDMTGELNIRKLLDQAEGIMGKSITNEQDAIQAKRAIEDVRVFSKGRGLDPSSLLSQMSAAGGSVTAALQQQGWTAAAASVVGAGIGRSSVTNGIIAAGDAGVNGMTGFTAQQSQAMNATGQMARMNENPQLVAAAAMLKTNGDSMDPARRKELQRALNDFANAGTQDERSEIQSRINRAIYQETGKSAMDWMGGREGMQEFLRDTDIRDNAMNPLAANVSASVMRRGSEAAFGKLTKSAQDGLGPGGSRLAGMVSTSFTEATQNELRKTLENSPDKLREFLEARKGSLIGADGKAISVDDAMASFGDKENYGEVAKGLKAYSRQFSMIDYTKAGITEEGRDRERGMALSAMLKEGTGIDPKHRKNGFLASLGQGLLVGDDGKVSQSALIGIAAEQAGRDGDFKNTRSANFQRDEAGNFTDASSDKLTKLLGPKGVEKLLEASGGSLDEFSAQLKSGDDAATKLLQKTLLGEEYAATSLDGKSLTVVDRESKEKADEMFTDQGRRKALVNEVRKGSKNDSKMSAIEKQLLEGENLGGDLVAAIQNNGVLEDVAAGNQDSITHLRSLDKLSGNELHKSMELAKISAAKRMEDGALSEEARGNARNDFEKLTKNIAALQNPADAPSMRVGTLIVEHMKPEGAASDL